MLDRKDARKSELEGNSDNLFFQVVLYLRNSLGGRRHSRLLRALRLQEVRAQGPHKRLQEVRHRLRALQHRPHGRGVQHQALHPRLRADGQVLGEGEAGGPVEERGQQVVPERGRGGKLSEIL